MNSKNNNWFVLLAGLVIIASCAKVSAPTGGTRDRIPPVVVESTPVNGQTNFHGKRLEIKFNEFVTLDNINDKFMVSPPMKQKPRVYTRGKSVRVDYTDDLRDSTTYTFYFMDAIKDLNEGNVLNGYKLAFSTGSVIDSLSVTGNVYNALDLEVPEGASVLLFSNFDDTAVVKTIPDYLARVDQTGYFRIDNVRAGKYRLFALKDEDNSKNYNRVEEPFAFLDSMISVTPEKNYIAPEKDTVKTLPQVKKAPVKPATPPIKTYKTGTSSQNEEPEIPVKTGDYRLILFQGPKTARYLASTARPQALQGRLLTYILSLPPDSMHFSFRIDSVPDNKYFIVNSRNRDTVNVWITDSLVSSRKTLQTIVEYPFTDSLKKDIYKVDTVKMLYVAPRTPRGGQKRQKLEITNSIAGGSLKPGQKILFTAVTPLMDPDTSRIRLYEVLEKQKTIIPYTIRRDTVYPEKLTLDSRFIEGRQYLLITDSAAFRNIYNAVSDSAGMRFTVRERASYSSLIINLSNCGSCIVQLLDKSEKVLAWKKPDNNGKLVFSLLEKGTYRIRAFNDLNGDGKWTTGDYFKKRQPEPVSYYDEIELPEGWDATQKWDITQWNYKSQRLRKKLTQR